MSKNKREWIIATLVMSLVGVIILANAYGIGYKKGIYKTWSGYESGFNDGRYAENRVSSMKYRWGYDAGYKSGKAGDSSIPVPEWKDVFDVVCSCGNHLHAEPCDIKNYKFVCGKCYKVYESNNG